MRLIKFIVSGIIVIALIALLTIFIIMPLIRFQINNLDINPAEVLAGLPTIISADIENNGIISREYTVSLKINGTTVDRKAITLGKKGEDQVSFEFIPENSGTYEISIGTATAILTVYEGLLPVWYSGDSWTYRTTNPTGTIEFTAENIGKGNYGDDSVYLVQQSPPASSQTFFRGTSFIDTQTLSTIEQEQSTYQNGIPVHQKTEFNYTIIEGSRWPLTTGSEWKVQYNTLTTFKAGLEITRAQKELVHTFNIEKKEQIETPAGTFQCFKIVERDEKDNIAGTFWYSDAVKREVRYELVTEKNSNLYELLSYDIQTTPPASAQPALSIKKSILYEDPVHDYIVYYPPNWQLVTREETASNHLMTTERVRELPFGSIDIRVVTVSDNVTLDKAFNDILLVTRERDSNFVPEEILSVPAAVPWHEITWDSSIDAIGTKGKTLVTLHNRKLYIVTGWVQKDFEKTYYPQLQRIIDSFGITNRP